MSRSLRNLVGLRFGKLVAIELSSKKIRGRHTWIFRCDCGNTVERPLQNITNGHTLSCGCMKASAAKKASDAAKTHGMSRTTIYKTWRCMIDRCSQPSVNGYKDYGGRGITVCEHWNSFENFFADMGDRPFKGAQIDRNDTNGNYEPSNCKWSTAEQNANNRRNSIILTAHGKSMGITQWARELNLHVTSIRSRLNNGWSIEDALTAKV